MRNRHLQGLWVGLASRAGRAAVIFILAGAVGLLGSPAAAQPPEQARGAERADVLIGFQDVPGPPEHAVVEAMGGRVDRSFWLVPAVAASIPVGQWQALERAPGVRYVELDGPVFAIGQEVPWGIERVFGDDAYEVETVFETWDASQAGLGVGVAVLDTGIDANHEDLAVVNGTRTVPGRGWDDGHGHGTHVAGTIAALHNDLGVVGVAPLADLYAVKVLRDNGSGTVGSVVAGIEWAVENEIAVLNMSLGGGHSQTLQEACDEAFAAGHLLVAAAGNSGDSDGSNVIFPAGYDSVIAVAASNLEDHRASFSSMGPEVELIAPGVGILSTLPGNDYGTFNGTSMASPHVAGAAALAWATTDFELDNVDIRKILQDSAEVLKLDPNHQGYGLVRADGAVLLALLTDPPATGAIQGYVTDNDANGTGIENATVSVEGTANSTTTDEAGHYLLEDVPVGEEVSVTAAADGYESLTKQVKVEEDEKATLNFSLSPIPTYTVSGKVTADEDEAQPLEGVAVTIEQTGQTAATNSDGVYEISGVEKGTYDITASKDGYLTETEAEVAVDNDIIIDFILELVSTPEEPTTVLVASIGYSTHGGRNSDRHLSVTIRLEDDFGDPVGDASVSIRLELDGGDSWPGSGTTGSDGEVTFTLNNAPSGTYTTKVDNVDAEGLVWDGETPQNEFEK